MSIAHLVYLCTTIDGLTKSQVRRAIFVKVYGVPFKWLLQLQDSTETDS